MRKHLRAARLAPGDELLGIILGRILAERAKLTEAERDLVHARLLDESPHVRRAAVDALGQHPDTSNIKLLVAMRGRIDVKDNHLVHAARIALRNQLRSAEALKSN